MDITKIDLQSILDLSPIHAASGLVKLGDRLYVIADEDLSLASFSLQHKTLERMHPLLPGSLPLDPKERKKLKPDWECLVILPSETSSNFILAIPSGSKSNRRMASLIEIHDHKIISTQGVDFSGLYKKLEMTFTELNIEGAAVVGTTLKLFQRGNGSLGQNAIIDLDAENILNEFQNAGSLAETRILQIKSVDLGVYDGVRLSFTDACTYENEIFFLAAAENTVSTYDDGQYVGAILGKIDASGNPKKICALDCPQKPEGLWIEKTHNKTELFIVTDADNSSVTSKLFYSELSAN